MADTLRVCNPFEFKFLFEFDGPEITGMFSPFAKDILDAITRASNVSIVVRSQKDQPGERVNSTSDLFTGCIGRLQTNQSDVMLFLTEYPSAASNITQGMVMMESITQFISVYDPSESRVDLFQLETSLNTFDSTVWLVSAVSLFLSVGLLLIHAAIRGYRRRLMGLKRPVRYKKIPLEVLAHMTDHGQLSDSKGVFLKTMFLVLSLFCFLVMFYFCSYIKTDLVVIPDPTTVRSYRDLLKVKCGVMFVGGGDTYQPFKFAPSGSLEKRLWDYSVSKYPIDLVLYKYSMEDSFANFLNSIFKRKMSLVTDSAWAPYHLRMMCSALLNREKLKAFTNYVKVTMSDTLPLPLTASDEKARVSQKGFISSALKSAPLKRLEKVLRRILEAGIPDEIMKFAHEIDNTAWIQVDSKGNQTFANMNKCMANQLILPDYSLESVNVGNLRNFPYYACYLLSFELFVLFVEVIAGTISFRREVKKARRIENVANRN